MGTIYSIVTYNKNRKKRATEAAEAWISEGVCAVGYCDINAKNIKSKEELKKRVKKDSTKSINELGTFLEIEKGDIILAYCLNSTIAAVGEVIGDYSYNTTNIVGKSEDEGGFDYNHQRKVKWFESPRYFNRNQLPGVIANKLGLRGKTTTEINYPIDSFLKKIEDIPSTYKRVFNEDLVKAGLSKYLKKNLDELEVGLKITHEENHINEGNKPDFMAKDKNGSKVIIECKGIAEKKDIKQIKRYRLNSHQKSRCFLIASQISDECRKEALKNQIEIFEVGLVFKRIE